MRALVLPALAVLFASGISYKGCAPPGVNALPPLAVELHVSRALIPPGGETAFSLIVTNRAETPAKLDFPTGQTYDFIVLGGDQEAWRWSYDRAFTQAFHSLALDPGESVSYQETWEARDNAGKAVAPGDYSVIGVLTSLPEQRAGPLTITVAR